MFNALIQKPKITLMFFVLLLIIGVLTFFQLPQREVPEITLPTATITTVYPGANAQTVERTITVPVEDELNSVQGISSYQSVSTAGVSTILIQLDESINQDQTINQIRQAVADIESRLPAESFSPSVNDEMQLGGLSSYHLVTNEGREELYQLDDIIRNWQKEIESINGVRSTLIKGIPENELLLQLDANKLEEYEVSIPMVLQALSGEFDQLPLGRQKINEDIYQLSISVITDIEEVMKLSVGLTREENEPVLLEDVATISIEYLTPRDIVTYEGSSAVSFTVLPEKGIDVPSLHNTVHERMLMLSEQLPNHVELQLFYTQNDIVETIFKDLTLAFVISVIVVIFVTLLGLNFTSAVIVAIAIPTSILLGLIPLPYLNVDLNQISIIGFIIALGILVDDAIVVNDNIERRYKLGDGPLEGAINGTKEVRISIITSTLAIVFTFLPLVFIGGSSGDFIRALPSVLITTIIASTIIALTVIPIFRVFRARRKSRRTKSKDGLFGNSLEKLSDWYSVKVIGRIVKRPWRVAISGLVLCTAAYGLVPFVPVVFFPSADREEVTVDIIGPIENTIEETDVLLQAIESKIKEDPAVYETARYTGAGLPPLFSGSVTNPGENTGQILIRVDKEVQTAEETIEKWSDILQADYPHLETKLTTIEAGPPVGAPIALKVKGPDIEQLMDLVSEIKDEILAMEEARVVVDDVGQDRPTLVYEPNRDVLAEHGFTMKEISEQIRLVTEGMPLGTFDDGFTFYDMRLVVQQDADQSIDLSKITLPSKKATYGPPDFISFDQLLIEKQTKEIQRIPHLDGERTVTIRVYPREGMKAPLETQITETISEMNIIEPYSVSIGGETEARSDFFIEVGKLFIIVVFLIFIVMAIQFNSLSTPILVMSTVYLAISGAVIGLFITQTGLGFMALMGVVSLAGIVVRNSIVLIEFIEQGKREGLTIEEAVMEAGRARLRPILLTALTAIAALMPIAFSGDVLFTPLAIAIISGIFFSTFLTLLLVPAFYVATKRRKWSVSVSE